MRLLPPRLAAREDADDAHEDGDDTLGDCVSAAVERPVEWERVLTLTMALTTVTMAFTTAMKHDVMALTTLLNCGRSLARTLVCRGRSAAYAGCDGTHGCGVVFLGMLGYVCGMAAETLECAVFPFSVG